MPTRNYHHGDLKSALIETSISLLETRGVEALSLRALAGEVGVSHMAPYAHFKNKTELFQAIAAHGFDELVDRLNQVDKSLEPSLLILEYGVKYIEFAIANAPLYRLMLSQTQVTGPDVAGDASPHMSQALKDASKHPFIILRDAFAKLFSDKQTQTIRAQGAWAMVHGLSALMIDGHLALPKGMTVKTYLAKASLQISG